MTRWFAAILVFVLTFFALIGEPTVQAEVAVADSEDQIVNSDVRFISGQTARRLGDTTVTFQDGVSGYTGTRDTYIYHESPATVRGAENLIIQDKNPGNSPPDERTSLLQFDLSSIPANITIVSAQLEFYVDSEGQGFHMFRMKAPWNEATASFTSIGNKHFMPDGIDAEIAPSDGWPGVDGYVGPITIPVQASTISDWVNGVMANNGWMMTSAHADDGVQLRSREHATIANRPKLTVVYNETPPNFAPAQPLVISPVDNATDVSTSPNLEINVADPNTDNLTVTYYGRPYATPAQGADFTIIAMPDTQHYTDNGGANSAHFAAQTQWIVDNKDALNIKFVSGLGDIVQNGNSFDSEWLIASAAYGTIENPLTTNLPFGISYGLVVGNHDQTPIGGGNTASTAKFNEYFGISRFTGRDYYGGHYGTDNDNNFELFSAGGMDFIVIHLEFDPTPLPVVVAWADNLLQTYSNRRAIVATHHATGIGFPGIFSSQATTIYNELKDRPNFFMMLGGHIHGEGRRQDTFDGRTVWSMLSDYQARSNGGDGWLRILTFSPPNNTITVKTYSPSLGQFETDYDSQFTLSYDMRDNVPFAVIGTNSGVPSGTNTSINWPGLAGGTEYEWYVTVSDGTITTTGPLWSFTTVVATPTPTNTATDTPTPTPTDTPTNTPTNTPTPEDTPSLNGTIYYGNSVGNPMPPRLMPNVSVSGMGAPPVGPVITGLDGTYTLTGFGPGFYTIEPTKPNGSNTSVNSNDAARIAQGLIGALPFVSNNQRFAADVSGNGFISSNDAALVARFAVGLTGAGNAGEWNFFCPPGAPTPLPTTGTPTATPSSTPTPAPTPCVNTTVPGPITGVDFVGIMIGEVSGNWNPALHSRQTEEREVSGQWSVAGEEAAVGDGRLALGSQQAIIVNAPHLVTPVGNEVVVSVKIDGVADKDIISYEFDLRYDPSVLQPVPETVDVAGTVSRGLSVVNNPYEPGLLRVAVYGAMPIDSNGVLLNLRFISVGKAGAVSPLTFERIMFNEGEPRVMVSEGRVEISN